VTNPYEDPDYSYLEFVNDEGQHPLWRLAFADVREGWKAQSGEAGRQEFLDYIEASWPGMCTTSSLVAATIR
jgi:uncharacterized protein YbdZ (MbtH family)